MQNIQKYIIIILTVVLLVVSGGALFGYLWQRNAHLAEVKKLNNALAASQQLIQETNSAISSKAFEIENLKATNKDLQKVINKNKEEIFAVTDIAIKWKNKYFAIKNATQTVVDAAGSQPSSVPIECETCFAKTRLKVEFDQTKDDLRIFGYTITSPAQAQINLEWIKPLKLQLVLTRAADNTYKVYLDFKDTSEADMIGHGVPTELTLKIDPSVFLRKWYEKINVGGSVGFGNSLAGQASWGGLVSANVGYLITPKINAGIGVTALYNRDFQLYYSIFVQYFPFARQ
jgi:hypothetical protein